MSESQKTVRLVIGSLIALVLVGGAGLYLYARQQAAIEREKIAATERKQQADIQAAADAESLRQMNLTFCLAKAQDDYVQMWNAECLKRSLEDKRYKDCVNVNRAQFGYPEDKLAEQCRIFVPKIPTTGCDLDASFGETYNKYLMDSKNDCYKRYPQ